MRMFIYLFMCSIIFAYLFSFITYPDYHPELRSGTADPPGTSLRPRAARGEHHMRRQRGALARLLDGGHGATDCTEVAITILCGFIWWFPES